MRIKGLAVDLQLIEIDVDIPKLFPVKVVFLLHADALVQFLLRLYFCSFVDLNFNSVVLYKLWIFQHIHYLSEIKEARVDSEGDWQLLVKGVLKIVKFFI